jgi:DNA polymerase-3 subunit epsilon
MPVKIALLDTETTGLDPTRHCLWSIALRLRTADVDESFVRTCRPFDGADFDDKALEVGGVSWAELATYDDPHVVSADLLDLLSSLVDPFDKQDKFHIVAYNARFDYDFLRAWWETCHSGSKNYFGSYFHFPPLDVMNLAALHLLPIRHTLPNFKQHTVARALGIDVDDEQLHDAAYDLELTAQLFKKLYTEKGTK